MSSVTWLCPNCKRRVPNRISTCHCGTTRAQADQTAAAQEAASKRPAPQAWTPRPRPAPRAPLGRDVKALLIGLVVVAILAVVRMLMPWRPESIRPVLGFQVPAPPPKAKVTPRPLPSPRAPAPAPTS